MPVYYALLLRFYCLILVASVLCLNGCANGLVPSGSPMHFIEIPSGSSSTPSSSSSSPPLLFLHGLFGSSRTFVPLLHSLSSLSSLQGRKLYAVDLANHGSHARTKLWRPSMSYPSMCADVMSFLDWLAVPCADVVGHSMGGKVAMALAMSGKGQERVRSLSVLDIAPVDYRSEKDGEPSVYGAHRAMIDVLRLAPFAGMTSKKEADEYLRTSVPNDAIRAFLLTNVEKHGGSLRLKVNIESIAAQFDSISNFEAEPYATSFEGRTLFINGENSKFVLPKYHDTMRSFFPNHQRVTLQGAGHWLLSKQQLVDELERFWISVKS